MGQVAAFLGWFVPKKKKKKRAIAILMDEFLKLQPDRPVNDKLGLIIGTSEDGVFGILMNGKLKRNLSTFDIREEIRFA